MDRNHFIHEKDKPRRKFYHSLKEHHKVSNTPKIHRAYNMKLPLKFRTKSTELSHFKALVVFVFAVYGILIPLWFAFHGNKLLDNNDQWRTMVISSTRIGSSQMKETGHLDLKTKRAPRSEMNRKHFGKIIKRSKRPPTLPKPLYSLYYLPVQLPPRQIVSSYSGRLLSMKWDHLCCESINCLRKFPLFPLLPVKKRLIRRLRLSENGNMYGQRIAGLLKAPESGSYSVYMKCLSTCEFWLSDNEYPLRCKLFKKIVRGLPVEHGSKVKNNKSLIFKVSLQAGRAYFMDVLLTVYRYTKHPFEVLWKLPSGNTFVPLTKEFFVGFQKNPESFAKVLKFYAHSPSVKLTPFLESIEEPGEDDDDFTILGGKTDFNLNFTFLDSQERPIFVNSSLGHQNLLRLPDSKSSSEHFLSFKKCSNGPLFWGNKSIKKYAGVWKTHFSSVFPGDTTGHIACIGNRYPIDCQGNKMMSRKKVSKVLTFYSKAIYGSKIRSSKRADHVQKNKMNYSLEIHHLVNIQEMSDFKNNSLFLIETVLKDPATNLTYHDSRYLYMNKDRSSFCLPRSYIVNWDVTVNVIVVAKRQTRWLRHFLANMEKIYVQTKDKNINIIIAKYGNDDEELMEEYQSNRLPSVRTVRHRGVFDKRRAIRSAVKKIKEQNSIIFLMDLHILVPDTILQLVRKHTIQGQTVFNPVLFRLSHCGSPASSTKPPRGFWETFGYGILGIYKSDWDRLGKMKTKKYKKSWGGEDWELLDRILSAGLGVQRLRIPNFYHFYHSKKGMWN